MANENAELAQNDIENVQHTNWDAVPLEQMNALLSRQYVTGTQGMLARIVLKKGCIVPRHSHPNEQISYITEGLMRFLLGDEVSPTEKLVRAGDVLVIPGGVPHSAEALEDSVDFDLFSPPRQDWIDKNDSYMR
jgi:quercetin dioxygenase-like cupin family protein